MQIIITIFSVTNLRRTRLLRIPHLVTAAGFEVHFSVAIGHGISTQ